MESIETVLEIRPYKKLAGLLWFGSLLGGGRSLLDGAFKVQGVVQVNLKRDLDRRWVPNFYYYEDLAGQQSHF
jgi:hypothetical protein